MAPLHRPSRTTARALLILCCASLLAACATSAPLTDDRADLAPADAVAPPTSTPSGAPGTSPTTTATSVAATTPPPSDPTTTTEPRLPASGVLRTPTGVLVPIRGQLVTGGWVVGTPCGKEAVVGAGERVQGIQVLLDAGHGGLEESGTIGPNGLWESVLNLDVSMRVEQWLRSNGVSVELTRRTDRQVRLEARTELATSLAPQLLVSIHHNGGGIWPSSGPGTLAFHQADSAASRRLAGLLYQEVATALAPLDLAWVSASPPGAMAVRNARGTDYYAMLRLAPTVPSAIIEGLYLTNAPEADALNLPEVRQLEAEAIGRAILRYLTTSDPGAGFQPATSFEDGAMPDNEPTSCVDPALT